jgi:hypothetical protein
MTLVFALLKSNCMCATRGSRTVRYFGKSIIKFDLTQMRRVACATDPTVVGKLSKADLNRDDWKPVTLSSMLVPKEDAR